MKFQNRKSRRAIAGIVATVIMFAIIFTVGTGYFIFVNAQNAAYVSSLLAATNKEQNSLQESLTVTTLLETDGDVGFEVNNTSSLTVNMTAALVVSSTGTLLKCDGVGFPAGAGCSNSTPTLWMTVDADSGSPSVDTGYSYLQGTTDTVKVLTARGNTFTQTYPEAASQSGSAQSVTVNLDNLKWVQLIPQASSLVQKAYTSNCNAAACAEAYGSHVTAGNILVDAVGWANQAPPSSVPTDTLNDLFTLGSSSSVVVPSSTSLVQDKYTSNCNAASCGLAFSSNVVSGHTLVYAVGWAGNSPPSAPTDTRGDTFTLGSSNSVTVNPATAAVVQRNYQSNCNSATCSLAYSNSVTAGNTLVYGIGWGGTSYVPITITNSQSSATPNPFQQMITWDPATYSSQEATNLGNIRFCTTASCTTELYSWLESCSSTCSSAGSTSTSATAWVKLTSSIAANGGQLTIYMVFESTYVTFDGIYWGEAPTLSSTYGQYDNGANVFYAYGAFQGSSMPSTWTLQSGSAETFVGGTSNTGGIELIADVGGQEGAVTYNTALTTNPIIIETLANYNGNADDLGIGFYSSGPTTNSGNTNPAATSGYYASYEYYGNSEPQLLYNGNEVAEAGSQDMQSSGDNYLYTEVLVTTSSIKMQFAETTTAQYSYDSVSSWTVPDTYSTTPSTAHTELYIGAADGGSDSYVYLYGTRARAYPPSNTMPSVSFGGAVNGAAPTVTDTLGDTFTLGASKSVSANGGTATIVQDKYNSNCNSATCSLAYTSSVTAGNTLVYALGWYGTGGAIPITITNSQSSATPNPFQQMITWDPATYSSYEATNLGNIRFCTTASCTTELDAWLESCSSTCSSAGSTSTSATAWVKLTSTIAASGGQLTIYMVFESTSTNFDDNYWGEAPQLSSTYAQYDNGANVFTGYFNGNTATSNFNVNTNVAVSQSTGVAGPGGTTINAIHISGYAGTAAEFGFKTALSNTAMIVEGSFADANDGTNTGEMGLVDNAAPGSVQNGINVGDGAGTNFFDTDYDVAGTETSNNGAGTGTTAWEYGSVTYAGTAATSWSGYIAPQLYSTTGGYTATVSNNPLSAASNVYIGGGFGSSNGGYTISLNIDFMRARAYPPSNTMPSTSFGSVQTTGAPSSVTDTLGTDFTLAVSNSVTASSTTYYSNIWYGIAPSSAADTITATFSSSVTGSESVYELNGVWASVTSTGSSATSQTSSSVTSMTPSSSGSIVIGNTETDSVTFTAGSGYTNVGTCTTVYGCSEYETGVGSATTVPMSFGASTPWVESAIAFAPTGSNYYSYIYYATASSSGADTVTATFPGTVAGTESVYEISGYSTSSPMTSTGSSSTASTAVSVTSFTPSTNSIVIGNVETASSTSEYTVGSGYTTVKAGSGGCDASDASQGCNEYETGLGSATTTPLTLSSSTGWAEAAISFAPATAVTYYSYIYYATASSSGADTISASFSQTVAGSVSIYEISGVTATGLLTGTGSSSTSQSGSSVASITPPSSGSIVIGNTEATSTTYTAGTGYTLSGSCATVGGCGEYQTAVTSGTTVPMSMSPSVPWVEAAVAFPAVTTTYYSYIWYATASASGADTVTTTFGASVAGSVSLYEITGYTVSGALSSTGSSSAGSTTAAVTSFTPSSDSFIVGNTEATTAVTYTASSGFTLPGTCTTVLGCSEYDAGGGGSANTVPITLGTSEPWVEAAMSFSTPFNPQSGIQVGGYPTMGVPSGASLVWEVTFTDVDPDHRAITIWPQTEMAIGSAEYDGFDTDYQQAHYYIIDSLNAGSTTVNGYTSTTGGVFLTLQYNVPTTLYFAATQALGSTTQAFGTNVLTPFEAYFALTGTFSDGTLFGETIPYPYGIITEANAYTTPTSGAVGTQVTVSCTAPCYFNDNYKGMVGIINSAGQLTQLTTFTSTASGGIPSGVKFNIPTETQGYYTIEVTDYVNSVFMTLYITN